VGIVYNYGGKIGLASVIKFVTLACKHYMAHTAQIVAFIDANSSLDAGQKTTLKAALSGLSTACELLQILTVTYEA